MEELIMLNALLRYHKSGFLNLHWNASGEEFDDAHKDISTDYYELCDAYIDTTAEMVARLDDFPLNFDEVAETAKENNWTSVQSDTLYSRAQIIEISQTLLSEILDAITDCLASEDLQLVENSGIRSDLEAIQEEFDLQVRYINKRRLGSNIEEEADDEEMD